MPNRWEVLCLVKRTFLLLIKTPCFNCKETCPLQFLLISFKTHLHRLDISNIQGIPYKCNLFRSTTRWLVKLLLGNKALLEGTLRHLTTRSKHFSYKILCWGNQVKVRRDYFRNCYLPSLAMQFRIASSTAGAVPSTQQVQQQNQPEACLFN